MSDQSLRPAEGYDKLARFMGALPENAIFRGFGSLTAEDLLYRQAELVELENALLERQKADKQSGDEDRQQYAVAWTLLRDSANREDGNDGSQLETILEIQKKLKEYQEALIRARQVLELGRPHRAHVGALNTWMQRPSMGRVYLLGSDRNIWSEPNYDDLVTLNPPSTSIGVPSDFGIRFVKLYNEYVGRHFHRDEEQDYLTNTIRYRDDGVFRTLKVITTLVSCLIPVVAVVALYLVPHTPTRLGMVAIFTAVFSTCISLTSASLRDIFMATTIFLATLVIFIGTNP